MLCRERTYSRAEGKKDKVTLRYPSVLESKEEGAYHKDTGDRLEGLHLATSVMDSNEL